MVSLLLFVVDLFGLQIVGPQLIDLGHLFLHIALKDLAILLKIALFEHLVLNKRCDVPRVVIDLPYI